ESPRPQHGPKTRETSTLATAQRSAPLRRRQGGWLDDIVARLPHTAHEGTDSYLSVLEEAMLDHRLSQGEREALATTAREAGLDPDTITELHRAYLQALAATAAADEVIGANERNVLEQAAHGLGLSGSDVDEALATAEASGGTSSATAAVSALANYDPEPASE